MKCKDFPCLQPILNVEKVRMFECQSVRCASGVVLAALSSLTWLISAGENCQ